MSSEERAAASDPLIGQVFGGKYSVLRLIGRGGVGLVYLVLDTETQEKQVLKLLSPDWSERPEAVRRFEREADRLGGVQHPNIVRLLDQGHEAGRAYLVMEHLKGTLLSEYVCAHGSLDLATFVPIAAQVLKGIGHAHSRGIMLRDIKPANIMLCERKGRANFVKILDFGLAKLIRDEQPVTEEHVLGTAGYLAPEVIKGDGEVDLRVDVFSLGTLFYFMLSGRMPFEGDESATVLYKTIHDDPNPLHDVLPTDHEIPEGLLSLVFACLAKDPNARPDDANAIVERLIDVVPASLFRLPKTPQPGVPQQIAGDPHASYGNTGLVTMMGEPGGRARVPELDSQRLDLDPAKAPQRDSEAVTLSDPDQDPEHTGPVVMLEQRNRPVVFVLTAAVLLLGGGFAYYALGANGSGDVRGASLATASEAGIDHHATISRVEGLIGRGALLEADELLDTVRVPARDQPQLAGRVERLDRRLGLAKLMASAATFEDDGQTTAAIAAYREVLATDPSHIQARQKLIALSPADGNTPSPATSDDGTGVPVSIGSRPLANLIIDGEPRGTTPFSSELSVGTHAIRMTARGYHPWKGEFEVLASGTEDLSVRLVPKGRSGSTASATTASVKTGAKPSPEPKPTPTPEPTPQNGKDRPAKNEDNRKNGGVFLPTKDDSGKNGGGVFLPTKD